MRLRPQRIGSSVYVYREGGGVALSVPCAQGTAHATIELCRPWWFRGPHLCVVDCHPAPSVPNHITYWAAPGGGLVCH
jgi:hypothetical protein